jgi:hypothetical protein
MGGHDPLITSLVYTEIGPATYRITAVSNLALPVLRWFLDGVPYVTTTVDFIDIQISVEDQITVDVFDQDTPNPNPLARGSLLSIAWERQSGSVAYRVEKLISGTWTDQETIVENGSRSYRAFVPAADEQTTSLRVVSIDNAGAEIVITTRLAFVVRVPDVPLQVYTVSEGILTVGDA